MNVNSREFSVHLFSNSIYFSYFLFRTTFVGLADVSAHDLVKAVQNWAATGPSIRVQWYVVDIDKNCPVAISSDVAPECGDSKREKCMEQCFDYKDKPQ